MSWSRTALTAMGLALALAAPVYAQTPDLKKMVGDILSKPTSSEPLRISDVSAGLKEALTTSANVVGNKLSAKDGYFGDAQIRTPLPGVLGDAQKRLKPFGMAGSLDDLQLKVNRAAEAAAPTAKKLIVDAVKSMTIDDAMSILRGKDTAATDFLRGRTQASLSAAFRPYISKSLDEQGAIVALDKAVTKYAGGLVKTDTKSWLTDKAVAGALDGLFYYIAREEQSIRKDPVKRGTDLLRRVFGGG